MSPDRWAVLTAFLVTSCGGHDSPSILEPISPYAARLERTWWILFSISTAVFAVVVWRLWLALARRNEPDVTPQSEKTGLRWIMWAGLLGPAVILVGVWVLVLLDFRALQAVEKGPPVTIEIIGKQWWWDIRYPQQGVVTANQFHVPVGTPVEFHITSADVQHSFWIPQAGPKRDAYPGRVNVLRLQFDEPGTYFGICSEFCGLQHANMQIVAVAQPADVFQEWLRRQAAPASEPETDEQQRGREVFVSSTCSGCHTIRGVVEASQAGPDLTHFADRQILAATLDIDPSRLLEFVHDPHDLKPGVLMPPSELGPADLEALTAYLESLE